MKPKLSIAVTVHPHPTPRKTSMRRNTRTEEGRVEALGRKEVAKEGRGFCGRYQGGDNGRRSSQARIQKTARMTAHGEVDRGRCHGGFLANDTRGVTDRDGATGRGNQDADGELMGLNDTNGFGDQGGARMPEDIGGAGGTENKGGARRS